MKIIAMLTAVVLVVMIGLAIYIQKVPSAKKLSKVIPSLYLGLWFVFCLAYYFHNEGVRSRYASFDFGGIVLVFAITVTIVLLNGIFKKKERRVLKILGLIPIVLISCIFIHLAPLNAELSNTISTFYALPWYLYYFLGAPVAAVFWDSEA